MASTVLMPIFRPGGERDVIVVVGVGLETRASRLVHDAGGAIDGERVAPGRAIGAHFQGQVVGADETKLGPAGKP
ncbi:hypothetical protein ACFOHS_20295 [Jhaorihella thermophila]